MVKQSGLFDDQEMLDTPEHLADLTRRLAIIAPQKVALEWARQIVGIERAIVAKSARVAATNIIEYMERFHGKDDVVEDWKSHFSHLTFNISAFIEAANPGMSSTRPWMEAIQARPLWVYRPQFLEKMPELVHQFSLASWIVYTKHAILFHINNGNDASRLNPESHYAYHRQYDSRYSLPWLQPRKFLMQPVEGHPSVFETPSPSPPLRSGTKDISTPTGASTPAGSRREALPELGQSSASKNEVCLSLTEAYLPVVLDNYFVNSYLPDNVKRRTPPPPSRTPGAGSCSASTTSTRTAASSWGTWPGTWRSTGTRSSTASSATPTPTTSTRSTPSSSPRASFSRPCSRRSSTRSLSTPDSASPSPTSWRTASTPSASSSTPAAPTAPGCPTRPARSTWRRCAA